MELAEPSDGRVRIPGRPRRDGGELEATDVHRRGMRRASARPGTGAAGQAPGDHRCGHAEPRVAGDARSRSTVGAARARSATPGPSSTSSSSRAARRRRAPPEWRWPYKTGSWSGTCTFPRAGRLRVHLPGPRHPAVRDDAGHRPRRRGDAHTDAGRLGDAAAGREPDAGAAAGGGGQTVQPQPTSLKLTLASGQRGTRVRGRVEVLQAASRLEVTLTARRVRVGRVVRTSLARGPVVVLRPAERQGPARAAQPQAPRRDGRRRAHAARREQAHTQSEGATARLASMACAA